MIVAPCAREPHPTKIPFATNMHFPLSASSVLRRHQSPTDTYSHVRIAVTTTPDTGRFTVSTCRFAGMQVSVNCLIVLFALTRCMPQRGAAALPKAEEQQFGCLRQRDIHLLRDRLPRHPCAQFLVNARHTLFVSLSTHRFLQPTYARLPTYSIISYIQERQTAYLNVDQRKSNWILF